jgi:hypothetical protein
MNYGCLVREIIPAVVRERQYQEEKYPEPKRSVADFVLAMQNELDEVRMAWGHESHEALMAEILQVVTLGVAAMEQFGVHERVKRMTAMEQMEMNVQDLQSPKKYDVLEVLVVYTKTLEYFGLLELYNVLRRVLLTIEDEALYYELVKAMAKMEPLIAKLEKSTLAGREQLIGFSKKKEVKREEEL